MTHMQDLVSFEGRDRSNQGVGAGRQQQQKLRKAIQCSLPSTYCPRDLRSLLGERKGSVNSLLGLRFLLLHRNALPTRSNNIGGRKSLTCTKSNDLLLTCSSVLLFSYTQLVLFCFLIQLLCICVGVKAGELHTSQSMCVDRNVDQSSPSTVWVPGTQIVTLGFQHLYL